MTRKIIGRLASVRSFVFALASLAALAVQAVSTSYINSSGVSDTADCTEITSSSTTLNSGWYVVNGTVNIRSTVTVSGDVNLILADRAKLTVSSSTMDKAGICVEVVDGVASSLSIYCQAAGTGELLASSSSYGPGIGTAGEDHTCGIVTIYGGNVYATGSQYGSGIGSGWKGAGGTVTINGGTVTAIGGSSAGAGIGGGYQGTGGTVIINGGTVTATAGSSSYAGIGGQSGKGQGSLTVGGNVVVKAGNSEPLADSDIQNPNGETSISLTTIYKYYQVELTGPKPLAQVTSALAAYAGELFNISLASTISGGSGSYTFSGTVPDGVTLNDGVLTGTLSAGGYNFTLEVTDSESAVLTPSASYTLTVSARPKSITYKDGTTTILGLEPAEYTPGTPVNLASYAKLGYTFLGWYDNDGLAGDAVTAVPAAATEDLTFWANCSLNTYTIQYYDEETQLTSLLPATYTVEAAETLPTLGAKEGYTFAGWRDNPGLTGSAVTTIPVGSTGNKTFYAKWTSNTPDPDPDPSGDGFLPDDPEEPTSGYVTVKYQTPNGVFQRKCKQLETQNWTKYMEDSWYYVSGEVTIESIEVTGKACLILGDGARLEVGSADGYYPGILLTDGNTLTIYGQSGGTGELVAIGGDSCAGIGGGTMPDQKMCGKLNVYGSNITAAGGDWAPGIGSTDMENDSTTQVFIYGGTVTATGSDYFGGIGGSRWYGQGTLTVGDNMTVKAGADADSAVELTPGAGGAVTLSAQKYFHIESTGSVPLAQGRSELVATAGDVIALSDTIVGGKKPYTFTGSVPVGLTLSDGTLTCTTAGSYNFSLTVTDDDSTVIPATYALTVETLEKTITYIDGTDGETVLTGLTPYQYIPGGSTMSLPSYTAVNKDGYRFLNWYSTPRLDLDGGYPVYAISPSDTGNKIFYAKFKLEDYTIFYYDHVDGALTTINTGSYTINDTPVALWTPDAKPGYIFGGWCEQSDCSDTPIFTLPKDAFGTKQLYVKWVEAPPEWPRDVSYVDENGVAQSAYCDLVTAETATLTNGGWYVVNDNVEIDGTITVEGAANLILADTKTLTVAGGFNGAGINVPSGSSLTIYGQSGGTGAISATGNDFAAGIGGNSGWDDAALGDCGTITINGGHIEATGGNYGAGIGGGYKGAGGNVTINGGYVSTIGGVTSIYKVPGIGRGGVTGTAEKPSDGTLTIGEGMEVRARDVSIMDDEHIRTPDPVTHQLAVDEDWRYIVVEKPSSGTGVFSDIRYYNESYELLSNIEPNQYEEGVGVELTAVLEKTGHVFDGWYSYDTDEKVTAVPADATGTYAVYAHFTPRTYNIRYFVDGVEDTSLTPKTYTYGSPVVLPRLSKTWYTFDYWCDNAELEGTSISLLRDTIDDVTLYARFKPQSFAIIYYDGGDTLPLNPSSYTIETETFNLPIPSKAGHVFDGWYTASDLSEESKVTNLPKGSTGMKIFYSKWHVEGPSTATDVPYRTTGGSIGYHDCKMLTSLVTELADDWYVLTRSVDYGEGNGITISGDVKLILADGATLTVQGDYEKAGINVPFGSTLTIYAQAEGTGAIVAEGGDYGAGIGGNSGMYDSSDGACGTVVINGGTITATAGNSAAGIGGGYDNAGGTVTINGGTVVATGVGGGAGIGGSTYHAGGDVTINGGTVTAVGGVNSYNTDYSGAGIGAGSMSLADSQGTLTIASGLSVKSGDAEESMTVIASTSGSVTLDGKKYYYICEDGTSPTPDPKPSINGDSEATVTGDAESGYTITPSTTVGTVVVVIPDGLDAGKVTVEVPATALVKPNGANVKVVKIDAATTYDITAFLDIPAADADGVVDLNNAEVKQSIAKEVFDPSKDGVDIDLTPDKPSITTAPTRPGLMYVFSEGTSLSGMVVKGSKVGDGSPWVLPITVKGGTSGFYSVRVTK